MIIREYKIFTEIDLFGSLIYKYGLLQTINLLAVYHLSRIIKADFSERHILRIDGRFRANIKSVIEDSVEFHSTRGSYLSQVSILVTSGLTKRYSQFWTR